MHYLLKYLIYEKTDGYEEWFPGVLDDEEDTDPSIWLYPSELEKKSFPNSWKSDKLPWNGISCLAVVFYVKKLDNNELHRVISNLDCIAFDYRKAKKLNLEKESQQKREIFSSHFVNIFMPMAQKFFKVPKLHELLDKDNSLKENEILASFLDFLLQILNSEAQINSNEENQYDLLQKELTFLLSLLGDVPFQFKVSNILEGIESLANLAGNFIYSSVFSLHPVMANIFSEGQCVVLKMIENLNVKIKEHCFKFSEHKSSVISPTYEAIDSMFIVNSLIEDLKNMMNNQIHLITSELKVQITTLQEELIISLSLLKDIRIPQERMHLDELNGSLIQVREVAYEAEYLINSYIVGNLHIWYLKLRLPVVVPKLKLIRMNLQEIKKIYDIKVIDMKKDFGSEVLIPIAKTNDIVVGFEDEITNITNGLLGRRKNRHIISIVGMPGVGKTTIANKLYNDRSIIDHFDIRGYCVVSQIYQKRKVLIAILICFSKSKEEKDSILKMEDHELSEKIHKSLKQRRYLVVVDDVWSTDVWDDLGRFFPDDGNGSRIMLTSRNRDVLPIDSTVHSLPLLTEEECWSLLNKKVFPNGTCPPQLQGIGKRVAAKCGGLPLAIVVTAGVLINLEKEESVWEKVETNLDSYLFSSDMNDYSQILELSFKHLPDHLKLCFLYVGAFPEDAKIPITKLTRLWISEGLIQRQEEKSLEVVAEEYLKDLINRSLILIASRKSDGRINACSIHDQLREMCLRKSHQVLFFKPVDKYSFSIYEKHWRMFDKHRPVIDKYRHMVSNLLFSSSDRSFGLYYRSFSGNLPYPSSRLPQMKLLKVMDLWPNSDSCSYELERVDVLVQLRYLSVDQMPKAIHVNFLNLEYLVIDSKETIFIPLVILKLAKLRHLILWEFAEFAKDCYGCQTSTNLRHFSQICIFRDEDHEILRRSPHLRKLRCYYAAPTLFPDLRSHPNLQILSLSFHYCFGGELTKVNFPSTLTNLKLSDLGLPWEEISILGRLPNLQVLKLHCRAFVGEEWETRDGEFQKLRFLTLLDNDSIKQWITCYDHFPQLECLVVNECINLEEIPREIGDIPTLEMIKVYNSGYGVYKSAVQIVEEQRENGNEELQLVAINEKRMEDLVQKYLDGNLIRQKYKLQYSEKLKAEKKTRN